MMKPGRHVLKRTRWPANSSSFAPCAERSTKYTDRILALLPKVPELRWDEYNNLMLGDIDDGLIAGEVAIDAGGTWLGGTSHEWIDQRFATREEARAAVEAAVRKALGCEA